MLCSAVGAGFPDRREGSLQEFLAAKHHAEHIPERSKIGDALIGEARNGDWILIMGARDDTLIDFARELLEKLGG